MAKQTVNASDVLNAGRTKINNNFTEVYDRAFHLGSWDASGNSLPVSADGVGSGASGAIMKGDEFIFSAGGTIDGELWPADTIAKAKQNNPTLSSHWRLW